LVIEPEGDDAGNFEEAHVVDAAEIKRSAEKPSLKYSITSMR
jgi:hypothetical protein